MDGLPKLVTVLESARDGKTAYFEDGMVAQYDFSVGIWRPAPSHISYEALFCTTTKTYTRATDTLDLTLAPDVAGVDD
jgi:hypothetical protein